MTNNTTPPAADMLRLINGFMASRAVHIAAELGIADLLAGGARSSAVLARATGTDPAALHRLLRGLASLGVLAETAAGAFALTPVGACLRTDTPDSVRNFAMMSGTEQWWRIWGDLLQSVRTGQSAMPRLYGMASYEYFAEHPQEAAVFNRAMADVTRQVTPALLAAYDFARFRTVVDVGGGDGTLLAGLLAAVPTMTGVVFDLPGGSIGTQDQLQAAGVADRCEVVAGDFFDAVPGDADAYILKNVLHNWDDERAATILRNCRKAMPPLGTLLLIERVMPDVMDASARHRVMAMRDLHMLVGPGGRERTEGELRTMLAQGGFAWTGTTALPGEMGLSVMEARPG